MSLKDWVEACIIASLGSGIAFGVMHFSGFLRFDEHLHWFITAPIVIGLLVWFVLWYNSLPEE